MFWILKLGAENMGIYYIIVYFLVFPKYSIIRKYYTSISFLIV